MQEKSLAGVLQRVQSEFMDDILNGKIKTDRVVCRYCLTECRGKRNSAKLSVLQIKRIWSK